MTVAMDTSQIRGWFVTVAVTFLIALDDTSYDDYTKLGMFGALR